MSLRRFQDAAGNEWQAFDVIPRKNERRQYDRRSHRGAHSDPQPDGEDRRDHDRRLTVGGGSLSGAMSDGWLCFEREGERRRLSPIPGDWSHCSDEQLEHYLSAARRPDPVGARR